MTYEFLSYCLNYGGDSCSDGTSGGGGGVIETLIVLEMR
jgi:hypothetical protein